MGRRLFALAVFAAMMWAPSPLISEAQTGSVVRDVAYGPHGAQRFDIHLPEDPRGAPTIFMVHGGAWRFGDKDARSVVLNKSTHWVAQGYVFVTTNYRLLPEAGPVEQAQDVAAALAAAQMEVAALGGDPDRFVLMGHSAGAHLVALVNVDPAFAEAVGVRPWLGAVSLDTAAYDVVKIMETAPRRIYRRVFGRDPEYWRAASPAHRVKQAPPPMLLVCSTQRNHSCPQTQSFATVLRTEGGRVLLLPVDLGHRQINSRLGKAPGYTAEVEGFLETLGVN